MEIITTIISGIDDKELNVKYRKAWIWQLIQAIADKDLKPLVGPTVNFGLMDMHPL